MRKSRSYSSEICFQSVSAAVSGLGVECSDRRLKRIGAAGSEAQRPPQARAALVDRCTIPAAPILLVEQHQSAIVGDPRGPP